MSARLTSLVKLPASEQRVIALLRGRASDLVGPRERKDFALLTEEARRAGLTISLADAPFLGEDEAFILGCLSAFQRRRPEIVLEGTGMLKYLLYRCAVHLNRSDTRLAYRNLSRILQLLNNHAAEPKPLEEPSGRQVRGAIRSAIEQSRLIRYLAERGVASRRELNALGISQYVINRLYRRGTLVRLDHGRYAASPQALARL